MKTDEFATNDELASYLTRQRRREVNRALADIEILRRNRTNLQYLLTIYLMVGFVAVSIWSRTAEAHWASVPFLVFLGAMLLLRLCWRLDQLVELCLTRGVHSRPT